MPVIGEGITYWRAAISEQDSPEVARAKISAVLEGESEGTSAARLVAEAIGLGEASGNFAWAVRLFLEAAARRRPLVAVFDDIHWAEPALLDLIEHRGRVEPGFADLARVREPPRHPRRAPGVG